jgi:hypothetical protein
MVWSEGVSCTRAGLAVASVLGAGVLACSSDDPGSPEMSCLTSALGSDCTSCLQSSCSAPYSSATNACGDFVNCVCPGDQFDPTNLQVCLQNTPSSCQTALDQIFMCSSKACASQCGGSSGDGGACAPNTAANHCEAPGYLPCNTAVCCPPVAPFDCPATQRCYPTEAMAAAACGGSTCYVCN